MGILTAYLPPQKVSASRAPAWAAPFWEDLLEQLSRWCLEKNVLLEIDDSAQVYED